MVFTEKTDVTQPLIFSFSTAVTLKIRSRAPKSNLSFVMSQLQCIYLWKFIKNPTTGSHDIVQTRKCKKKISFPTAVTLKILSRSPKPVHFFVTSQLYIHEYLVRIQPLVLNILCRHESVMPTSTPIGSASKSICPPPVRKHLTGYPSYLELWNQKYFFSSPETFHSNPIPKEILTEMPNNIFWEK